MRGTDTRPTVAARRRPGDREMPAGDRWPPVANDLAALVAIVLFVGAVVAWLPSLAGDPVRYQPGVVADARH